MKLLLDTGKVDPESRDIYGRTPLMSSAMGGEENVIVQLLNIKTIPTSLKSDHKICGVTPS